MSLLSEKTPSDSAAQCPDCGVTLSRLADMNRHRKTKHPDGTEAKFLCPWIGCGYQAAQKGNLKSHVDARHSNGPRYPCSECGRPFTDSAARIRHRKKLHGYVPYHTNEYLARQALNRKERVVQGASNAVSNEGSRQHVDGVGPHLPNAPSSAVPPLVPKFPEVAYHNDVWKVPAGIAHLDPQQTFSQGVPVPLSLPFETSGPNVPNAIQTFPSPAQSSRPLIPSLYCGASSSVSPLAPKLPEVAYHDDVGKIPVDITHLDPLQPSPYQDVSVPFSLPFGTSWPNAIQTFPSPAQSLPPLIPSLNFGASSSVPPPAPKLLEVAYHDIKHLYPPQPSPSQGVPVPLSLPFETPWSNAIQTFSSPAQSSPSLVLSPNDSLSVPPPSPKYPEVAYHDDVRKIPVDIKHLYAPQPSPSQGVPVPLSLPFATPWSNTIQTFSSPAQSPHSLVSSPNGSLSLPPPSPKLPEVAYHDASWKLPADTTHLCPPQQTWPGYGTYNAIQGFPSAAQSPPSLSPSSSTINDHPDLLSPQLYTTQSLEQQLEELLTGNLGMLPDNGNGQLQWPLQ